MSKRFEALWITSAQERSCSPRAGSKMSSWFSLIYSSDLIGLNSPIPLAAYSFWEQFNWRKGGFEKPELFSLGTLINLVRVECSLDYMPQAEKLLGPFPELGSDTECENWWSRVDAWLSSLGRSKLQRTARYLIQSEKLSSSEENRSRGLTLLFRGILGYGNWVHLDLEDLREFGIWHGLSGIKMDAPFERELLILELLRSQKNLIEQLFCCASIQNSRADFKTLQLGLWEQRVDIRLAERQLAFQQGQFRLPPILIWDPQLSRGYEQGSLPRIGSLERTWASWMLANPVLPVRKPMYAPSDELELC